MDDTTTNESDIRRFLDEPSSQLENENAWLSEDDEDWYDEPADDSDADPTYIVQTQGNDSFDDLSISEGSDVDVLQASTSKKGNTGQNKKRKSTKKPKLFKPKRKKNKSTNSKFPHVWKKSNFVPTNFQFDSSNSGLVDSDTFQDLCREIDLFEKLIPNEVIDFIVDETNKEFIYVVNNAPPSDKSRLKQWLPLTANEFRVFLATTLLMVHGKKNSIDDYWSNDPLQKNSAVSNCISRDRYKNIMRLLHFSDNTLPPAYGRLTKIKNVVDMFRQNFAKNFVPFKNLCIDESLLLFKGQLGFKQFIPSKRSRFGIKLYVLCDCETGYILDMIVYTGKDSEIENTENLGTSGAIVTTLLKPYLNKGHCLYVDNFYSSPDLFQFLHLNRTNACGTVRADRVGMPEFDIDLRVGEREVLDNGTIMALRWVDKRQVIMLTTEHDDKIVNTGKVERKTKQPILKPKCISEYNCNMGAVDRSDMMVVNIECIRRTTRWYKKLFFHLLDMAVLNAHALYLCKTGKKPSLPQFHLELIRQLLDKYLEPRQAKKGGRPSGDNPARLTMRHFPSYIPATEKKSGPCRPCIVCKYTQRREKKRRETRYMCAECQVALCAAPCFAEFHELKNY